MSRRRRRDSGEAPGEDSFLDIVANLVGVLIILVVVVGAQAGASWSASAGPDQLPDVSDQIEAIQTNVARQEISVKSMTLDNRELEDQIVIEQRLTEIDTARRNRMLADLKLVRTELERERAKLDESRQTQLNQSAQISKLRRELQLVNAQSTSMPSTKDNVKVIEHHPTPIARTVFKDEIHFQLRRKKLILVPLPELIDLMRGEWEVMADKLTSASRTIETVGPIGPFRLQYELESRQVNQQTQFGPVVRQAIQFRRFVVVPANKELGESIDVALQTQSMFLKELTRLDPNKHTISVWVYPDSYREFETLKEWLYDRGFQIAVWPLSASGIISGGPDGYRSTAQ